MKSKREEAAVGLFVLIRSGAAHWDSIGRVGDFLGRRTTTPISSLLLIFCRVPWSAMQG